MAIEYVLLWVAVSFLCGQAFGSFISCLIFKSYNGSGNHPESSGAFTWLNRERRRGYAEKVN
jgi:hypothetical protein